MPAGFLSDLQPMQSWLGPGLEGELKDQSFGNPSCEKKNKGIRGGWGNKENNCFNRGSSEMQKMKEGNHLPSTAILTMPERKEFTSGLEGFRPGEVKCLYSMFRASLRTQEHPRQVYWRFASL